MSSVLCFDLGASSGRGVIVTEIDNNYKMQEIHRFTTKTKKINSKIYWDFNYILQEIKIGIEKAFKINSSIKSIAFDTWGCDYGWLDENGNLLRDPRSYREPISKDIIDKVHSLISFKEHYKICGNGHFNFNTIYQLYYDIHKEKILEKKGKEFLFIPNLIFYFLTGKKLWEFTIASTSGLLNIDERNWSKEIFKRLNFPENIKGGISKCENISYPLKKSLVEKLGLKKDILVTLAPGHDSACAVVGAPLNEKSAYLINGTWSLLGIEHSHSITNSLAMEKSLVNEGSIKNKIRFMSMNIGTWLFQKLKDEWKGKGEVFTYTDFQNLAKKSNTDFYLSIDTSYLTTEDMEEKIKKHYFEKYSINIKEKSDILKVIYNSLGNTYKEAFNLIKNLSKKEIDNIVLLGGGNQDKLLIETIKKSLNIPVIIGPIEASILGNAYVQFETIKNKKERPYV